MQHNVLSGTAERTLVAKVELASSNTSLASCVLLELDEEEQKEISVTGTSSSCVAN